MNRATESQQVQAMALLKQRGMARLAEFTKAGITAATVSRMKQKGLVLQLSRGLYQLPDAPRDVNHPLAQGNRIWKVLDFCAGYCGSGANRFYPWCVMVTGCRKRWKRLRRASKVLRIRGMATPGAMICWNC